MWMMGCNEGGGGGGGGGFNTSTTTTNFDSLTGRKLRPLIPKPCNTTTNDNLLPTSLSSNPPCLSRLRGSDIILFNNHLELSKREMNPTTTIVSSRWNPTPEQLRTLEELYKRGTRTPSADQIQHITAQLRRYGKIEGKNVFYWFQNHKARERQKRRRRSSDEPASGSSTITDDNNNNNNNNNKQQHHQTECLFETNESRMSKICYEVEQTKNWHHPTNCSTLTQEPVSVQGAALVSSAAVESRNTNGWIQLEDKELHQRRNSSAELQATWHLQQMLQQQQQHFSSANSKHHLIDTATTPSLIRSLSTNPKLTNTTHHHQQNLSFLFASNKILMRNNPDHQQSYYNTNDIQDKSQTLELFPLRKDHVNDSGDTDDYGDEINEKEKAHQDMSTTTRNNMNTTPPYQFFEFL
ncbi:hypothetical protein MKX03_005751 [Papaver bracteatum]|nr:hypothetical protein MKX03_005751 [Papaver bracteatum]